MKYPPMPRDTRNAFINAYFMNNLAKTPSKISLYNASVGRQPGLENKINSIGTDSNIKTEVLEEGVSPLMIPACRVNNKISKRKSPKESPGKLRQQKLDSFRPKEVEPLIKASETLGMNSGTQDFASNAKTGMKQCWVHDVPLLELGRKEITMTTTCSEFDAPFKNTESKATAPSIHHTRIFGQKDGTDTGNHTINFDAFLLKKPKNEISNSAAYHSKLLDFINKNKCEAQEKPTQKIKEEKKPNLTPNIFDELYNINIQKNSFNAFPDYKILDYHLNAQYKVSKLLGKGSFAEVRLGTRISDGLQVAVKTYSNTSMNSQHRTMIIQNEIRVLKSINHQNIVKLLDIVVSKDYTHLILEYCEGINIYEFMWNRGKLGVSEAFAKNVFTQLLSALEYLHSQKIYHRDLKLDNIMIDKQAKVTLIDFGFAVIMKGQDLISSFCGTPNYMAPEIYLKKKHSGASTDLWALTVILYKMVVSDFPFKKSKKDQTPKTAILNVEYDKPSTLSSSLIEIFEKVFVMEPERRICMSDLKKLRWF